MNWNVVEPYVINVHTALQYVISGQAIFKSGFVLQLRYIIIQMRIQVTSVLKRKRTFTCRVGTLVVLGSELMSCFHTKSGQAI